MKSSRGSAVGPRVEPCQGGRHDRAIERRRPVLVGEQDEADGPDQEYGDERYLRDEEAPEAEPFHGVIVCGAALRERGRRHGPGS